jgi:hypothetical protein
MREGFATTGNGAAAAGALADWAWADFIHAVPVAHDERCPLAVSPHFEN